MKEKLIKGLKEFHEDEDGSVTVMVTFIMVMSMMLFILLFNVMWMSQNRYHIQLMCDAASRAGTQAVEYSYAVRERTGHGYGDYHVYVELNETKADSNVEKIINRYKGDINGFILDEMEINESGTVSPLWNSRIFDYEEKSMSSEKQYQNGVINIRLKAKIPTIGSNIYGGDDMVEIEHSAQSVSRGTVTNIR